MIERFEVGKWYALPRGMSRPGDFNERGLMDFMLDGKPHRCLDAKGMYASFEDQLSLPRDVWPFNKEHKWNWNSVREYLMEVTGVDAPQRTDRQICEDHAVREARKPGRIPVGTAVCLSKQGMKQFRCDTAWGGVIVEDDGSSYLPYKMLRHIGGTLWCGAEHLEIVGGDSSGYLATDSSGGKVARVGASSQSSESIVETRRNIRKRLLGL